MIIDSIDPNHCTGSEKVMEMVMGARQEIMDMMTNTLTQTNGSAAAPLWSQSQSSPLTDPLLLQLSILETSDALQREMNSFTWQAMLRALGGDREILTRFAKLQPQFARIDTQLSAGRVMEQFKVLGAFSGRWNGQWSQLERYIAAVTDLYDWFNLYQRNVGAVNENTLRIYAESVHSGDNPVTTIQVIESIHKFACPDAYDTVDDNATHPDPANPANPAKCHNGIFQILANAATQVSSTSTYHCLYYR